MSLFLGKIHYWLFNKIKWFEEIEDELLKLDSTLNVEELDKIYGERTPNKPLEEIIDTSNIHGWLQERIIIAEGRNAYITKCLIDKGYLNSIEKVYETQGEMAGKEVKSNTSINDAREIFTEMNNYILDGMPCDRVNEIVENSENKVVWKRRVCVHKDIFNKVGLDVGVFYSLREKWIKNFVSEINSNFEYIHHEDDTMEIKRRG
ncbi:hypothetical protein [Clostridium paraputrificum]|uniref:Uncharacterized protein n=1 Tax=Clostridium paraputrificum TaxID=29363 RepID=A0A6N3D5F3_9CLOT